MGCGERVGVEMAGGRREAQVQWAGFDLADGTKFKPSWIWKRQLTKDLRALDPRVIKRKVGDRESAKRRALGARAEGRRVSPRIAGDEVLVEITAGVKRARAGDTDGGGRQRARVEEEDDQMGVEVQSDGESDMST